MTYDNKTIQKPQQTHSQYSPLNYITNVFCCGLNSQYLDDVHAIIDAATLLVVNVDEQ